MARQALSIDDYKAKVGSEVGVSDWITVDQSMIDQFAEVDARMKWASNKRLYLEIGVIKAVHSLEEVLLSDVIATLEGVAEPGGFQTRQATQSRPAATPPATLSRARAIAMANGVRYAYTGNVHDRAGDETMCPGCHRPVIERARAILRSAQRAEK